MYSLDTTKADAGVLTSPEDHFKCPQFVMAMKISAMKATEDMLGWQNPKGDKYFRVQRREVDECEERAAIFFHKLMMK
ncbi:hypothetical protein N7519_008570 [Penicillium mononematosum]|uniref:uncharacterized protein n=1 Tax=Penicillium mononematosum TaxID=268346 RepID=UPI002548C1A7|nr:uncharacterized protein N7519_008570 [Penicillium mononematosum]KAJ6178109.1 hypothetical protein N7519_008570 [Penicillium mononematosum]